ncbi:MAG: polysaccharide deacetylase family protein, partial [Sedimentisphaerales bacterium]|nr:polysaccharide deacetylase family protein [Sedimentisphaerales bacterium]
EAFPVLQNYDYTATVFLPTGFIDIRKGLKGKNHLQWNEILELSNNGITFGSHTVTHPQLKFLKEEDIEYEIRQSKEIIENNLGIPVESFSHPFAFPEENKKFTKYLRKTLQKYEYKHGVSTRIGMTSKEDDIYFMKRIPVNSCDDILFFNEKLEGGYDWLYHIQRIVKAIRPTRISREL